MELTQSLLETPLAQLSVKDFVELMNTYNKSYEGNTSNELFDEDSWLSGYKSLAKFLKCSVPTVCRIVKSGKIDSAMRKVGGTYWFQTTKCKINSWQQFSDTMSLLAIVVGVITTITKRINKESELEI